MTSPSVTKSQFAALRGVTPGRVSQWIGEGKIHGPALEGEGRNARIVYAIACEQLGFTLDPVQAVANGQQASIPVETRPGSAAPVQQEIFSDQRRLAKIKADQAEMAYERERREFEAETGRYMLTVQAEAAWARIFGTVIADLEAGLPSMATEIARQIPSADPKLVTIALRNAYRNWRKNIAALAETQAAAAEPLVEDPDLQPSPTADPERRSDEQVAA